ncbi:MAG: alanine--tRNA ligase [Vicingus serpentipes]|nr:alanine--tRNA ligase [Vicingus serpentipes]
MNSKQIRKTFLDFFAQKQHHIVPSAPMVVKNDPTLMFINAGMNQFKDLFLGNSKIKYTRIADTQKCLRVSGKHNDLEEVGVDTYHHTMFEMLGNWSFGDYFKKEAIEWAWELLVDVYKIDKNRLYFTVFEGDEKDGTAFDEEAYDLWEAILLKNGLTENHILKCDKKDNFWEMGDTGPCGPCSEIHVDIRSEEEVAKIPGRELVNQDHPQVIEIWNLVFMEFNRMANGELKKLPAQHVDTGMGFERLAMVLQGKQSNYDSDVFTPLIDKIVEISGVNYQQSEAKTDVSIRVIADHVRAVAFSIADGQLPSNTGAGYVIRRILRRAIRYGYSFLNLKEAFIYQLVEVLVNQMSEFFPELKIQQELITNVIREEEESFLRTLAKGMDRLYEYRKDRLIVAIHNYLADKGYDSSNNYVITDSCSSPDLFVPNLNLLIDIYDIDDQGGFKMSKFKGYDKIKFEHTSLKISLDMVEKSKEILEEFKGEERIFNEFKYQLKVDGKFAFELYDTFGFPIDLTKLIVEELNGKIDEEGFEEELQKQKDRSRAATKIETDDWVVLREDDEEEFIGYDYTEADISITKYRKVKAKGEEIYQLVFNLTPFYPEGGGQVGDIGTIKENDENGASIHDTKKENNLIVHYTHELPKDVNAKFKAEVTSSIREQTACNHTATHLLHQALREVLGTHVEQKGSLVNAEYLRFDFSHFQKVSQEELDKIEVLVNARIQEGFQLEEHRAIPITEAEAKGAMMLFGEKYGDVVRMIQFGDSKELCGGIHVKNTKNIQLFKIKSEGSVASGIRRIEALTSVEAGKWLKNKVEIINRNEASIHSIISDKLMTDIKSVKQEFLKDYENVAGLLKIEDYQPKGAILVTEALNKAISDFTKIKLPQNIIDALTAKKKELAKADEQGNKEEAKAIKEKLLTQIEEVGGVNVLAQKIDLNDSGAIKDLAFQLKGQIDNLFLVLGAEVNEKPNLTIVVSDNLVKERGLHAGNIIREAAKEMQGGGGGQPFYATAGGKDVTGIEAAIAKAKGFLN